jgi:AcrR family transcriptional regulator
VRAELTREIVAAAHEELIEVGPAGLSLRAVARRLEMVPSALYRYFASRDALLTALIIEGYEALGSAAAAADQSVREDGGSVPERWAEVTTVIRRWGHEHPHEWALLYGSPVPGYQAPRETVEPALRISRVIGGLIADAVPAGNPVPDSLPPAAPGFAKVVAPIEAELLPGRPPEVVAVAVLAWTQVIGMISLELFGHFEGGTSDFGAVFDYAMTVVGRVAGIGDE